MYIPQTEAEISLIGCLLVDPALLPHIAAEITEEDLYLDESKAIFSAALDLQREGKQIDVVTIVTQAGMDDQTGRQFAFNCMDLMPTTSGWKAYLDLMIEESRRRKAYNLVNEIRENIDTRSDISEIQTLAANLVTALTVTKETDEMTMKQAIMHFCETKDKPREYIKTGFPSLDRKTFIDKGDYVIIGGRPSAGKTAFAINLATSMAKDHRVAFFSGETKKEKIADRQLTAYSLLNFNKVKEQRLDESDWEKFAQCTGAASKLNLTIVEAAGRSVAWIQSKAMKLNADIIFIDYLSLLKSEGKSRYEKVTNTSIDLHVMAQQAGITIFALSQLNRNGIGVPGMEDLRESGQIEQDADLIILLYHNKEAGNHEVIVAKNKEGITGVVPLKFFGEHQLFREIDTEHEEPDRTQNDRKAARTYRD